MTSQPPISVRRPVVDPATHARRVWLELPKFELQDLRRRAPDGAAEALQQGLRLGLAVEPEKRRPNFYEASIDGHRYYFHVFTGRRPMVFLLARWRER